MSSAKPKPAYLQAILDKKRSIEERADALLKLKDPSQRLEGALIVGYPDILDMCEARPELLKEFCGNDAFWLKLYEIDFQLTLKKAPGDLQKKGWKDHYDSIAEFVFEEHSDNDSDLDEWQMEREERIAAMKKDGKLQ